MAANCIKMRLAAGLRLDPLGSYSAPPDSLAVIRGRRGLEGKGKERAENRREVREGSKAREG